MIKVQGTHNTAVCYCRTLEETAYHQIKTLCDQPAFADCKIRIMPDVHAGKGCTIGTTMTITDKVVPNMVGVDIGCGMETIALKEKDMDFKKLDAVIQKGIPNGRQIRSTLHPFRKKIDLSLLRCSSKVNQSRAYKSIGTLGGGNHFIEVGRNSRGKLYLVIHSGSRHIGNEVAKYYQEEGFQQLKQLKNELEKSSPTPRDLAYVKGQLFDDYIHDMKIIQKFAQLNRKAMAEVILKEMGLTEEESFTTIHNYIDTNMMILRKGAVSAKEGEKLLIPLTMRDGSLICIGKGNQDWNFSAPHGAGRLMSRKQAKDRLSLRDYQNEMQGIFTTCVDLKTLDEAPMAYKSMDEIISQISPTAEIMDRIKPVYNFKARE